MGGKKVLDLVSYDLDPKVVRPPLFSRLVLHISPHKLLQQMYIMSAWPGVFDNKAALALSFQIDDQKTGFMDAVQDFQNSLTAQ